jgi:N-acetyl-gamma-glutamylphosphate reductase
MDQSLIAAYVLFTHRHAMEMAEKAEREILKETSNIIHVGIQLRLGQPFPHTSH